MLDVRPYRLIVPGPYGPGYWLPACGLKTDTALEKILHNARCQTDTTPDEFNTQAARSTI
jgi:hypothetical protein